MSDLRKDKPFIVMRPNAFPALKRWLKDRGCNTYSYSRLGIINVGYDTKPGSDWGGRYEPRGYILIKGNGDLFDQTIAAIRKAYGMEVEDAA